MSDTEVSRNRPKVRDHQRKAVSKGKSKIAFMHVETDPVTKAVLLTCSCGSEKFHKRRAVADKWADRHIEKKHQGRAIWQEG
jgi:hypothetical protein